MNGARPSGNVFTSGRTGAGKTRMLMRLAAIWRRVIAIDPTGSLALGNESSVNDALKQIGKGWLGGQFVIRVRPQNDGEAERIYAALNAARNYPSPKLDTLLLTDEVDLYAPRGDVNPDFKQLTRYGRHIGLHFANAARYDVDVDRVVRAGATQILAFRQGMLSPEMQVRLRERQAIDNQKYSLPALVEHTTQGEAEEGVNFIGLPDAWPVFWTKWRKLAGRSIPPRK